MHDLGFIWVLCIAGAMLKIYCMMAGWCMVFGRIEGAGVLRNEGQGKS